MGSVAIPSRQNARYLAVDLSAAATGEHPWNGKPLDVAKWLGEWFRRLNYALRLARKFHLFSTLS
jgi:hypothetical protein